MSLQYLENLRPNNAFEKTYFDIAQFYKIDYEIAKEMLVENFVNKKTYTLLISEMLISDELSRKFNKARPNLINEDELIEITGKNWITIYEESIKKYPTGRRGFRTEDDPDGSIHEYENELGLSTSLLGKLLFDRYNILVKKSSRKIGNTNALGKLMEILIKYNSPNCSSGESKLATQTIKRIISNQFPIDFEELVKQIKSKSNSEIKFWSIKVYDLYISENEIIDILTTVPTRLLTRFKWNYQLKSKFRKSIHIAIVFILLIIAISNLNDIAGLVGIHSVKFSNASVTNNGGIGSEWSFEASINGTKIRKGALRYFFIIEDPLQLAVKAIEHDKYSDVGSKSIIIETPIQASDITIPVTVRENRGPGAGKRAEVEFKFQIR